MIHRTRSRVGARVHTVFGGPTPRKIVAASDLLLSADGKYLTGGGMIEASKTLVAVNNQAIVVLDLSDGIGGNDFLASPSTLAEEHDEDGLAEDPKIPDQRPVGDVIQVEPDHLFVVQFAPPADLPGASQPGEHLDWAHLLRGLSCESRPGRSTDCSLERPGPWRPPARASVNQRVGPITFDDHGLINGFLLWWAGHAAGAIRRRPSDLPYRGQGV